MGINSTLTEACEFFERAVDEKPDYGDLRAELGLSYYQSGMEDKAIDQFKEAIRLSPFLPEPYHMYGAILLIRGESERAIGLLEKAAQFSGSVDVHNVLGAAYAHQGRYDLALREFLKAYDLNPAYSKFGGQRC